MNKTIHIGYVGQDPEEIADGKGARFSVAVSEFYRNKETGETEKTTTWLNFQAWRKTADYVMKYIQKGDHVAVEGKVTVRKKDDKTYWNIQVDRINRLNKRESSQKSGEPEEDHDVGGDNDLPF